MCNFLRWSKPTPEPDYISHMAMLISSPNTIGLKRLVFSKCVIPRKPGLVLLFGLSSAMLLRTMGSGRRTLRAPGALGTSRTPVNIGEYARA